MRFRRAFALVAAGSVGVVSGCAGGGEPETVVVTSTQWVDPETGEATDTEEPVAPERDAGSEGPSLGADWQSEYEWVLSHPGDYAVNSAAQYTPDGTYEYALVEATGGGTPELLLAVGGSDTTPVIVFTIGEDGKARASTDVLVMGAPGNGGGRLAVWASAGGRGVYQISGSSLGKESVSELFALNGTSLSGGAQETFPSEGHLPDHQLIDWIPVSNPQPLHDGNLTVLPPSGESASGSVAAAEEGPAVVAANGDAVFTGNVEAWSTEQARQGRPTPNDEDPDNVYYVLVFDSPVSVTANKAGSQVAQESPFARLGSVQHWDFGTSDHTNGWDQYVGKRVRLHVPAGDFGYSSDASLPFGSQLGLSPSDIEVLN